MLFRLRQRCLRFPSLWVLLLGITLIWQPALMAAGEAHEGEHALQAEHAHGTHADAHDHVAEASTDAGLDPGEGWHRLLHLAHCCVHSPAMTAETPLLCLAPAAAAPVGPADAGGPGPLLTRPLRPPIRA